MNQKSMFNIEVWLESRAHGYNSLSENARRSIKDFALLWSLFEANFCDTRWDRNIVQKNCDTLANENFAASNELDNIFSYFQKRYIAGGKTNKAFAALKLAKKDSSLVESLLLKTSPTVSEKIIAVLTIIYRFRNNYFHGTKWAYSFDGQEENFRLSNEFLAIIISVWTPKARDT